MERAGFAYCHRGISASSWAAGTRWRPGFLPRFPAQAGNTQDSVRPPFSQHKPQWAKAAFNFTLTGAALGSKVPSWLSPFGLGLTVNSQFTARGKGFSWAVSSRFSSVAVVHCLCWPIGSRMGRGAGRAGGIAGHDGGSLAKLGGDTQRCSGSGVQSHAGRAA